MDEKIKELEQKFLHLQHHLLENADKRRDIDEAMGDTSSASKEKIKIDMYNFGINLFEEAKKESSFEAFANSFISQIDTEREKLKQLISQAREQGHTQEMIANQIRMSILDGPIGTAFQSYFKQVQQS